MRGPSRVAVGALSLAGVALVLALDLATAVPLDPFQAPPPAAFGSGLAASGAHCAAPAP